MAYHRDQQACYFTLISAVTCLAKFLELERLFEEKKNPKQSQKSIASSH